MKLEAEVKIANNLGHVRATVFDHTMIIFDTFVDEAVRHQGHGAVLLQEMVNVARSLDCDKIVLHVNNKNIPAVKLYNRAGFIYQQEERHMELSLES